MCDRLSHPYYETRENSCRLSRQRLHFSDFHSLYSEHTHKNNHSLWKQSTTISLISKVTTIQVKHTVLLDFYATWCGPCKALLPLLERLATEYEGKLKVLKVDVDKNQALAEAARIMSIPTLFFIDRQGNIERTVGGLPYPALVERVEALLQE